jgi:concanavalin A-like lectin/glucanase superfamily protein
MEVESMKIEKLVIILFFMIMLFQFNNSSHYVIVNAQSNEIIAHWDFNENSGIMLQDTINANNGDIHGCQWTKGIEGSALYFDGTNDYVEIQNNQELQITGDLTITIWIKPTGSGNNAPLIVKNIPGSTGKGYGLYIDNDNTLVGKIGSSGSRNIYYNTPIKNDIWTHITLVNEDGKKNKIYINGILAQVTIDESLLETDDYNLKIGGDDESSRGYFNGIMDEIVLYDYALTQDEIFKLNPLIDKKIVSYWSFDESYGNKVVDLINNNNGTLYGPIRVKGIVENAIEFDGIDDYVIISDADELDLSDTSFTISFWCFPKNTGQHMELLYKAFLEENFDGSWSIRTHNDDLSISFDNLDGGSRVRYSNSKLSLETWSMVTLTYNHDDEIFRFYINDVLDRQVSKKLDLKNTNRNLYIGSALGEKYFFEGLIDEVKMYHDALSLKDIQSMYSNITNERTDNNQRNFNITLFEERWNSYFINTDKWNFVDNVDLRFFNIWHRAFIYNKELYINAYTDWVNGSGIISKEPFPKNSKLTIEFEIRKIREHNEYQSIFSIMDSGNLNDMGQIQGDAYIKVMAGNNSNRRLCIYDLDSNYYEMGHYEFNKKYSLEIIFSDINTTVSLNNHEIEIERSFSNYHVYIGGHVQKTKFDNLKILGRFIPEQSDSIPDLFINNHDIVFSNNDPTAGDTITIYASIHNRGLAKASSIIQFYEGTTLIGTDYIAVEEEGISIASMDYFITDFRRYTFNISIIDVNPSEFFIENNVAYRSLNITDKEMENNPHLMVSLGKWSHVEILENSNKKIPVRIICYDGCVNNVQIQIINNENISIEPMIPFIDLYDMDSVDYYLNITAYDVPENISSFTDEIYIRAIGENNIASDVEYMQITVHQFIPDTPDFTVSMMVAATGMGALVAFFRRSNRNRKI